MPRVLNVFDVVDATRPASVRVKLADGELIWLARSQLLMSGGDFVVLPTWYATRIQVADRCAYVDMSTLKEMQARGGLTSDVRYEMVVAEARYELDPARDAAPPQLTRREVPPAPEEIDYGRFLADRGDAPTTLELLRRAGEV